MKNIYQINLLLLLIFTLSKGVAQTPMYFFGDTYTLQNSIPLAFQQDIRSQILIPANAFAGAPFGQNINRIYFVPSTVTAVPTNVTYTNFRLRIGNVTATNLTGPWESSPNVVTAIDLPSYTTPNLVAGQWFSFNLPTPVSYNPSLPLLIDISFTARNPTPNWFLFASGIGAGLAGHIAQYGTPSTAATATVFQNITYRCGIDLISLGPPVTIPPIASFANTDRDTVWLNSPKVVVNTSNGAAKSYWDIIGFNGTNKFGAYLPFNGPTRTPKISNGINDVFIDTINNATNFNFTFSQRGWYRLKVVAVNQFGNDTYIDTLYVDTPSSKPRADFIADRRLIGAFDFASFFDLSSNGPTQWFWYLRPGFYNPLAERNRFSPNNGSMQNPNLNAFEEGIFDVCLVAINERGRDTMCKPGYMRVLSGTEICKGTSTALDTISFLNTGSAKLVTVGGLYQPNLIGACAKGYTIQACTDTLIINLDRFRMRVNATNTAADSLRIRVGTRTGPIVGRFGGRVIPASVSRRVVVPGGIAFIEVFINTTLNTPAPGVPGDSGFVVRWESELASYPKPTAAFSVPDTIYSGYTVRYNNLSTGRNMVFAWDTDGDGVYGVDNPSSGVDSISANPSRTFTVFSPFLANVCLKVSNCRGSDTACKQVRFLPVNTLPRAEFTVSRVSGFTTDTFRFTDRSQNGPNQWLWRFEPNNVGYLGGTNPTSQNPMVLLNSATSYTVTLIARNALGLDSIRKVNVATAIAFNSPGCSGCPVASGVPFIPNSLDIGISRVQLADMDTATDLRSPIYHALFNLKTATIFRGVTYTLRTSRITSVEPMSTRAWIDLNRNTAFGDVPEEIIISETNQNKVVTTGTFRIPDNTPVGNTRLRVGVTLGATDISPTVTTMGCYEEYGVLVAVDNVKPVLTLRGSSIEKVEVNKQYVDSGVIAIDNLEGDISSKYQVIGTVDVSRVGFYMLKYIVSDLYGNVSDTVIRTVQVEVNQTGPVLTLNGLDTLRIEVYNRYIEQGAIARSNTGTDITSLIIRTGTVDTSVVGMYTIQYSITDQFGFNTTKRRVVFITDTTKPVINSIAGPSTIQHQVGTPYGDPVEVTDNYWKNLTATRTGVINTTIPGTYTLTYNAKDGSNNAANEYRLNVVVRDLVPPTISLLGANPLTVDVYSVFNDPGVSRSDNYYPNVQLQIKDQPNTGQLGVYVVTYIAIDGAGNMDSVQRTVIVVDRIAPRITLLTPNPTEHVRFTPYEEKLDETFKINDNYYSSSVLNAAPYLQIDYSNFNPTLPGLQLINITVTDPSGNRSETVTRFVNVVTVTSVDELNNNSNYKLYPNPTKDKVWVNTKNNASISSYKLHDVLGREVASGKVNSTELELNMTELQNGIYLLLLEDTQGNTASQKVVKE